VPAEMTGASIEGSPAGSKPRRTRLGPGSLRIAVLWLAAAVLALGGVEIVLLFAGAADPPWQVVLFPVVGWVYLATGVAAWLRRPSNRVGALLIVGALAWIGAGLANTPVPELEAIGLILTTVPLAVVVHLLLAFPSGRLRDALSSACALACYLVALVLQAPGYLFGSSPDGSTSPLYVADRPDLADVGHWAQQAAGGAVLVVTAIILSRRLRDTAPQRRYVLAPLYLYAIAAVLWLPASADLQELALWDPLTRATIQLFVLAGIPVALTAVLLLGGFARTSEIDELGAWLGDEDAAQSELHRALADTLGDPSLELAFWDAPSNTYVDAAGERVELPATGTGRATVEVAIGSRRIGAIAYDGALIADAELVRRAGRVVAVALDRERLTAELRASRERLRASRARVIEAADTERRRIARDLHDSVQTKLVMLAIQAHVLRSDSSADDGRAEAAQLESGLHEAISELRVLAQGLLPAVLVEGGLYAAVEDLAGRSPLPIALDLDTQRHALPAPVESAGYFVVSEALTNAIKHAHASDLGLRIERTNGRLTIEVRDDGVGGAQTGMGAGLRSIADRVEALEGWLSVDSPPGGGTRILAEVPCGS
jgi:signal transduction histidine kinase